MTANSHEGDEVARPYHHGQLREALISVSLQLAEEGGPEAISIREAARRSGVAANAAYRHFEDLNHLRAEVALRARARLREAMQAELEARPRRRTEAARAKEQLSAVGRGYIRFALRSPNLFRCAWMDCSMPDPEPSPWSLLLEALDGCAAAGLIPSYEREAASAAAWSLVHGFAELALRGLFGPHDEASIDRLGSKVLGHFLTSSTATAPAPRRR
jgi:AcrR family transcriptional regulator